MTPTIDHLLTEPAELLTRVEAGRDGFGDVVYADEATATLCNLQQAGSHEEHESNLQVASYRLFLPADADVRGWDAMKVGYGLYELNGDPYTVASPLTGAVHHVEAMVTRTSLTSLITYDELDDDFGTYQELTDTGLSYAEVAAGEGDT